MDVFDLSFQHVGPTPAVFQRAVVVLYGPLESWENECILNAALLCVVQATSVNVCIHSETKLLA